MEGVLHLNQRIFRHPFLRDQAVQTLGEAKQWVQQALHDHLRRSSFVSGENI